MINIKNYEDLKEKDAVSLVKVGEDYAVSYKKYDQDTGEQLESQIVGVNMKQLLDAKTALLAQIVEIDAFIVDCDKL